MVTHKTLQGGYECLSLTFFILGQWFLLQGYSIVSTLIAVVASGFLLYAAYRTKSVQSQANKLLLLFLIPGLLCNFFAVFLINQNFWNTGILIVWVFSLFMVLGAGFTRREPCFPREFAAGVLGNNAHYFLLFCGISVAIFFRLWRLSEIPPGLWGDEVMAAETALGLLEQGAFSPFQCTPFTRGDELTNLYLSFILGVFKLFGINYLGVKMISVLPGILVVIGTYILARKFTGKDGALLAVFFIALSHWHVGMSRWGWFNVLMSLLQVLSCAALLHSLDTGKRGWAFLSGSLMGCALYTYLASRIAFVISVLFVGVLFVLRKAHRRTIMINLAWFFLGSWIVLAPIMPYYIQNPEVLTERMQQVSCVDSILHDGNITPLLVSIKKHALMFHYKGDRSARHNPSGGPMLDPLQGLLFLAGLGLVLVNWRKGYNILLLLWLMLGLCGGILTEPFKAPQSFRTFMVVPVLALMSGIAFQQVLVLFSKKRRMTKIGVFVACIAGVTFMLIFNFNAYFNAPNFRKNFALNILTEQTKLGQYMQSLDKRYPIFIYDRPIYHYETFFNRVLQVLTYGILRVNANELSDQEKALSRYALFDLSQHKPWRVLPAQKIYYVTVPEQKPMIQTFYPQAKIHDIKTLSGKPLFSSVLITARDVNNSLRMKKTNVLEAGQTWTIWSGAVYVESESAFCLRAPDYRSCQIFFDNRLLGFDQNNVACVNDVKPGLYAFKVKARGEVSSAFPVLEWQHDAATTFSLLPEDCLYGFSVSPKGIPIGNRSTSGMLAMFSYYPYCLGNAFRLKMVNSFSEVVNGKEPYCVLWQGFVHAETGGLYRFGTVAANGSCVEIDSKIVLEMESGQNNEYIDGEILLSSGYHPVSIKSYQCSAESDFHVFWQRPGGVQTEIVPENFYWRIPAK